jgi:protein O-mannosyl-transferase
VSEGAPPRNPGRRFAPLAIAVLVFLVYLPDVRNGFVYDDHEVILQQAPVRSLGQLLHIFAEPHGLPQSNLPYYRPTTRASLLLQKGLHGDEPALFHLVNALLMSAVAVAAHALLRSPALGLSAAAAAWAATAFALHPIASECVHPIASGRESSMPAIFMLASLAAWLRGGARGRIASVALFGVALWSKEQAIVVPLLIALADLLRLAPDPPGRRLLRWIARLAPFAIVLAIYLAIRGAVVPQAPDDGEGLVRLAAHWRAHPFGPLESLLFLLQSAFAPNAALFYEPSFAAWFSPRRAVIAVLGFAATLAIVFALRPAERPAPSRAASLFWVGWLPVAMLLNANLLPLEALFAERYVFVSSLGVAALVATAGRRGAARLGRPHVATAAGVAVLIALAATSLHRGSYYRDELAFTRQWVATAPGHANAHASLGAALARDGRLEAALAPLREAVRLEPRLAAAHYNLGATLAELGRRDEAIAAFRETLRQWDGDADAHYALGVLLAQRGEVGDAQRELHEAIRLRPGWAEPAAVLRRLEAPTP